MIVTVFRSRLKPGLREDYVALANRMKELAQTIPGYISHKDFYANDGERVAVVEFAHEEGQRAWQTNPEHRAAQRLAHRISHSGLHARSRVEIQAARASCGPDLTAADRGFISSPHDQG
jgi:heme-degrading monooxygenase HmoA